MLLTICFLLFFLDLGITTETGRPGQNNSWSEEEIPSNPEDLSTSNVTGNETTENTEDSNKEENVLRNGQTIFLTRPSNNEATEESAKDLSTSNVTGNETTENTKDSDPKENVFREEQTIFRTRPHLSRVPTDPQNNEANEETEDSNIEGNHPKLENTIFATRSPNHEAVEDTEEKTLFVTHNFILIPVDGTPPNDTNIINLTVHQIVADPNDTSVQHINFEVIPPTPVKGFATGIMKKEEKGLTDQGIILFISQLNTLLAGFCITLNTAVVWFYYRAKSNGLANRLYFRIGLADWFCGLGILLQGPALAFHDRQVVCSAFTVMSYILASIAVRMSVLMNCQIGVTRGISIVRPFYHIKKSWVSFSTLLYLVFLCTLTLMDVAYYEKEVGLRNTAYLIKSFILRPNTGFSLINYLTYRKLTALTEVCIIFLPFFVLPVLICTVAAAIQCKELRKPALQNGHARRAATQTILILTLIYIVSNMVGIVAWLAVLRADLFSTQLTKLSWGERATLYFSSSTCPLLCSTLTPLTLLIRRSKTKLPETPSQPSISTEEIKVVLKAQSFKDSE